MEFDAVLVPARRAQSIAKGYWHDRTINDDLDACVATCPDKLALTAVQAESGAVKRFTYRELSNMADRVAIGLTKLGVGKNDIVACQLPNWWQFTVTYLACSRIGAVMNPLMHIFRERELSFMLKHGEAKVVIIPQLFRGFDFEKMVNEIKPNLPDLKHVVVVNGTGANSFEALLSGPEWEKESNAKTVLTQNSPGPDDVTQLIYTSGTTGEPQGMPIMLKSSAVLLDVWEPLRAIDLIRNESATFTMASTPFLTDLAKNVEESGKKVPTLRTFLCAGAPIPGPLVEQARSVLGTKIVSAWGMTENGAVTLIELNDPDERAFTTDGLPLPGVELKVVNDDGVSLPAGEAGKLYVRSCSNFGGYLKRAHLNGTDAEGWFDTGDLARLDAQGYVRITGRSKDVIIRGGENIPVVEIESLLYRHPAIAMAAIVSYPDERLGERACAVVVLKPGQSLDLPSLVDYLKSQKVALQYIPEKLEIRDAMPATPSGKIQKFKLRELLRDETH